MEEETQNELLKLMQSITLEEMKKEVSQTEISVEDIIPINYQTEQQKETNDNNQKYR